MCGDPFPRTGDPSNDPFKRVAQEADEPTKTHRCSGRSRLPLQGAFANTDPGDTAFTRSLCGGTQDADDVDALHDRARAAGADVTEVESAPVGDRRFTATDPEGQVWVFAQRFQ